MIESGADSFATSLVVPENNRIACQLGSLLQCCMILSLWKTTYIIVNGGGKYLRSLEI